MSDFQASEVQSKTYDYITRVEDPKPKNNMACEDRRKFKQLQSRRLRRGPEFEPPAEEEEEFLVLRAKAGDYWDKLEEWNKRTAVSFQYNRLHDIESLWHVASFLLVRHQRQRHIEALTWTQSVPMRFLTNCVNIRGCCCDLEAGIAAQALCEWFWAMQDTYRGFEKDLTMAKIVEGPSVPETLYPDLLGTIEDIRLYYNSVTGKVQVEDAADKSEAQAD